MSETESERYLSEVIRNSVEYRNAHLLITFESKSIVDFARKLARTPAHINLYLGPNPNKRLGPKTIRLIEETFAKPTGWLSSEYHINEYQGRTPTYSGTGSRVPEEEIRASTQGQSIEAYRVSNTAAKIEQVKEQITDLQTQVNMAVLSIHQQSDGLTRLHLLRELRQTIGKLTLVSHNMNVKFHSAAEEQVANTINDAGYETIIINPSARDAELQELYELVGAEFDIRALSSCADMLAFDYTGNVYVVDTVLSLSPIMVRRRLQQVNTTESSGALAAFNGYIMVTMNEDGDKLLCLGAEGEYLGDLTKTEIPAIFEGAVKTFHS